MEKHGFKGVFFDDDRHNSQVSVFWRNKSADAGHEVAAHTWTLWL
jgi:hypothetical protein